MDDDANTNDIEKIAIVGMAGRFPGANTIEELWKNLKSGIDAKRTFSDAELLAAGVPESLLNNPSYVKSRCVMDDVESFDSAFFEFTPRESELTDPQHRIFLECAWEALESAGYVPKTYDGSIGVFAGCGMNQYLLQNIIANQSIVRLINERQLQVGSDKDFLSTRVSYKLNLKGPSFDIQTACSTSLVAIHVACQNLLDYQCDMALTGGAYVHLPRVSGFLHSAGDMRSPDGFCRAFDADANGTVFGDGVGVVVLKRLQDALDDLDTIFAVIGGTAVNNDGANKAGFSAPSVDGQASVISMAHMMAGVSPDSISYIEAHGTGTNIGDPIEIRALTKAFRVYTKRKQYCAIGSIKTNIGHLDAASGVTGLIKAALSVYHGQIPPSLNFRQPNPELNLETSPFYVNMTLADWNTNGQPRRAGVSSFGVGGTNAHAVVEEAPAAAAPNRNGDDGHWRILSISARTESALDQASDNLKAFLEKEPQTSLADMAYTLHFGRHHFDYRRTMVCNSIEDAVSLLNDRKPTFVHSGKVSQQRRSTVFLFTGQGAQYIGMAIELYRAEQVFRDALDHCADVLMPEMGLDLRDLIFDQKNEDTSGLINQTKIAQPALFTIEYALVQLWGKYGIEPQSMIGHSIGEYVAACIAGVFSLTDALKLVAARGALMQQQPTGAMLSITLSEEDTKAYIDDDIELSVINGPTASVVSGEIEKIEKLKERLSKNGVRNIRLHTSHAFHSKMMEPIMDSFKALFETVRLENPQIPFMSNVTGDWITDDQATDPTYWAEHLRHAVRFLDGAKRLLGDANRLFIEIGPGNTLCTLVRQIATHIYDTGQKVADLPVVQSLRHPKQTISDQAFFLHNAAKLWQLGVEMDAARLYEGEERYRIPLPTYPFERNVHWIHPDHVTQRDAATEAHRFYDDADLTVEDTGDRVSYEKGKSVKTNGVEEKLLALWKRILGHRKIDLDDNYFELGGSSLMAVRMFEFISREFGKTLPISVLYEAPTVRSLSKILTDDQIKPSWSSLVKLFDSKNGKKAVYIVHAEGGNVLRYRKLTKYLNGNYMVYGLQALGLEGKEVVTLTLEEMASIYLYEIKRAQPSGPYYIGGYCFGGLVAYEIAKQLIEQGETVLKLFLISTSTPSQLKNKESQYNGYIRSIYGLTYRIKSEIEELSTLNIVEKIGYLKENYFRIVNSMKFKLEDVASSVLKKMNLMVFNHSRTYYLRKSIKEFNKSYLKYEPKPIDIGFLIIPVTRRSNLLPDEDHLGWENMSRKKISIKGVDSYHRNVMKEPYVKKVAKILNEYFQEA